MTGAVIENLSNRKLFVILCALATALVGFFLIGGIVSECAVSVGVHTVHSTGPAPSSHMQYLMTICHDTLSGTTDEWFWIRPEQVCTCNWPNVGCVCVRTDGMHDDRH